MLSEQGNRDIVRVVLAVLIWTMTSLRFAKIRQRQLEHPLQERLETRHAQTLYVTLVGFLGFRFTTSAVSQSNARPIPEPSFCGALALNSGVKPKRCKRFWPPGGTYRQARSGQDIANVGATSAHHDHLALALANRRAFNSRQDGLPSSTLAHFRPA